MIPFSGSRGHLPRQPRHRRREITSHRDVPSSACRGVLNDHSQRFLPLLVLLLPTQRWTYSQAITLSVRGLSCRRARTGLDSFPDFSPDARIDPSFDAVQNGGPFTIVEAPSQEGSPPVEDFSWFFDPCTPQPDQVSVHPHLCFELDHRARDRHPPRLAVRELVPGVLERCTLKL